MDTSPICWDGGELVCCSECPAAYHAACLGVSLQDLEGIKRWGCPHHSCGVCHRKTAAAGGLLFRCEVCASAFCEDHLPSAAQLTVHCARFQALGQAQPKQACFIHCSAQCRELAGRIPAALLSPQLGPPKTASPQQKGKRPAAEDAGDGALLTAHVSKKRRNSSSGKTGGKGSAAGGSGGSSGGGGGKSIGKGPRAGGGRKAVVSAPASAVPAPAESVAAGSGATANGGSSAPVANGVPLPPGQPSSLAARARALLEAPQPSSGPGAAPPVTCAAASAAMAAAVAVCVAAPLADDPRRARQDGTAGRLEAAILAAIDAAPPDPAAGRAVISLFKLRAYLASLPDPALADFAASKDEEGRLQLPAAISRLAGLGSLSWRSHQKTAVQGPKKAD